jgi:hypothetical protein
MPELTGSQLDRLSTALTQLVDKPTLTRVLDDLHKDQQGLAEAGNYGDAVNNIVQRANQERWADGLLLRVSEYRSNRQQLAQLCTEVFDKDSCDGVVADSVQSDASLRFKLEDDDWLYGGVANLSHGSVGSIHVHLDGARDREFFWNLKSEHETAGFVSELNRVVEFHPGPQRRKESWRDVYATHTPGIKDEALNHFLTTRLHDGPKLPTPGQWERIRSFTLDLLTGLHDGKVPGLVVELERVIAVIAAEGAARFCERDQQQLSYQHIQQYLSQESLIFRPTAQLDRSLYRPLYELHFSVNIPKAPEWEVHPTPPPMDLATLSRETEHLDVGGWFLFHDRKRWAYRSNGFTTSFTPEQAQAKWQAMSVAVSRLGRARSFNFQLRLLVEESLGVWKSPLTKFDDAVYTVKEMAKWEAAAAKNEFWVVAANFLGDQDEDVQKAVVNNIDTKGVTYRYFLRSNADAVRWSRYKDVLRRDHPALRKKIDTKLLAYVVSLNVNPSFPEPCFIANPGSRTLQEGMSLKIDPFNGRIYGGELMSKEEIADTYNMLRPWELERRVMEWREVGAHPGEENMAVVYLRYSVEPCHTSVEDFDRELAVEISKAKGEVFGNDVRHLVAGFLGEKEAITRAVRFIWRLRSLWATDFNSTHPKIAIDWGPVQREIRSFGLHWEGDAVGRAAQTANQISEPGIFLSGRAAKNLTVEDLVPAVTLELLANKDIYRMNEASRPEANSGPAAASEPARDSKPAVSREPQGSEPAESISADGRQLSGPQQAKLIGALKQAFDQETLTTMLLRLDMDYSEFEAPSGFSGTVLKLVTRANKEGWPLKLLLAARAVNPGNPQLIAFEQQLNRGLVTSSSPGQLEKIVNQRKHFDHLDKFLSRLGKLSQFVCLVEVPGGGGTGVLVGPDLVLTNYHVVEQVVKGGASPSDCHCRFDFKAASDGTTVAPGVAFAFVDGPRWNVATSSYSQADLVADGASWGKDDLDFALLRLQGSPGTQPVALLSQQNQRRGWLSLSSATPALATGDTLYVIQHPRDDKADPPTQLPQQFATGNVLTFMGEGLRVRHDVTTLPGSSGSPCFNDSLQLVALHHAGEPGNKFGAFGKYNQAIPLGQVARWLREHELQGLLDVTAGGNE